MQFSNQKKIKIKGICEQQEGRQNTVQATVGVIKIDFPSPLKFSKS